MNVACEFLQIATCCLHPSTKWRSEGEGTSEHVDREEVMSQRAGRGDYGAVIHYRKPRDVCLTLLQLLQTIKYSDGRIYSLICSDNFNLVLLSFVCSKLFSIVRDRVLFLITCMTVKLTLIVFYWHIIC